MTSIQGKRVSMHRYAPSLRAFSEWCDALGIEPQYRHYFISAHISAVVAAAASEYMEPKLEQWADRLQRRLKR